MTDFQQALSALKPGDLSFLSPERSLLSSGKSPATSPPEKSRRRRPRRPPPINAASGEPAQATKDDPVVSPAPGDSQSGAAPNPEAKSTSRPIERPYGEHVLPVFRPVNIPAATLAIASTAVGTPQPSTVDPSRKRTRPARDWPAIGTKLSAEYFGQTYHAEVVAAKKKLMSGKQIRLLDGPAAGKRLDSFSKAMLVATAKQRRAQKLNRRGVASGWTFWIATTPPCKA